MTVGRAVFTHQSNFNAKFVKESEKENPQFLPPKAKTREMKVNFLSFGVVVTDDHFIVTVGDGGGGGDSAAIVRAAETVTTMGLFDLGPAIGEHRNNLAVGCRFWLTCN